MSEVAGGKIGKPFVDLESYQRSACSGVPGKKKKAHCLSFVRQCVLQKEAGRSRYALFAEGEYQKEGLSFSVCLAFSKLFAMSGKVPWRTMEVSPVVCEAEAKPQVGSKPKCISTDQFFRTVCACLGAVDRTYDEFKRRDVVKASYRELVDTCISPNIIESLKTIECLEKVETVRDFAGCYGAKP